jgi:hypothetical protein
MKLRFLIYKKRTIFIDSATTAAAAAAAAALLLVVIFSPLALREFGNSTQTNWSQLSSVGQTYGAISALLTAMALISVVASLLCQAREARLARHGCHDNVSGGTPGCRASSASVTAEGYQALLLRSYMQKRSNSPLRTPPRNACHSSDVNRRTAPSDSLLLRTPISPPGRLATSTQLPLAKLRELLTQLKPEFSGWFSSVALPTVLPH